MLSRLALGFFLISVVIFPLSIRVLKTWQSSPLSIILSCFHPFLFSHCVQIDLHGFKEIYDMDRECFPFFCVVSGAKAQLGSFCPCVFPSPAISLGLTLITHGRYMLFLKRSCNLWSCKDGLVKTFRLVSLDWGG